MTKKRLPMNRQKNMGTKISNWIAGLSVQAADFSVQDMQGKTHRLADYRGHWVLVNFWATWCPPCLNEIPELNRLHDAHKDMVVLGVAMQSGTKVKVAEFVAAHHMRYPVVMGSREMADQIRFAAGLTESIEGLPTSYLFGPKGELVYDQAGELKRDTLEEILKNKKPN
jgi:peroxiredoxin